MYCNKAVFFPSIDSCTAGFCILGIAGSYGTEMVILIGNLIMFYGMEIIILVINLMVFF